MSEVLIDVATPPQTITVVRGEKGDSGAIALADHVAAANPHPQYTTEAEVNQLIADVEAGQGLQSDEFIAAIAISALRIITVSQNSWIYASSDQPAHGGAAIAISKTSHSQGSPLRGVMQGLVSDSNWNWSLGRPIYLGLNGLMTQNDPTNAFWRIVAFPISSTQILFNPQEAVFL